MMGDYGEFYETSLKVLNELLDTDQLTANQYWNAVFILPLIDMHPSQIKLEVELQFLFFFGSISKNHPDNGNINNLLNSYSIENGEIYTIVRDEMNVRKIEDNVINYTELQKAYKARIRRYKDAKKTIEAMLEQIDGDELKENIKLEVDSFAYRFTGNNLRPLKEYFLVYLERLFKKYNSNITKDFLETTFNVKSSGWMKMLRKMEEFRIEVKIENNPDMATSLGEKILEDMCDNSIISNDQLVSALQMLQDIQKKYSRIVKGKNQGKLIAFMSIRLSTKLNVVSIAEMFTELDIIADIVQTDDKRTRRQYYYLMFYRALEEKGKNTIS